MERKNKRLLLFLLSIACLAGYAFAEHQPGETQDFGSIPFVWCPPGQFVMGTGSAASAEGDPSWFSDKQPAREVTIEKGFWISRSEITREQWALYMQTRPWAGVDSEENSALAATGMDVRACREFAEKLGDSIKSKCTLPSEEEWEYACRAGGTDPEYGCASLETLGEYAWHRWNSEGGKLHPVGQKKPNAWGISDMHGNAWEWTATPYLPLHNTGESGLSGYSVIRGGSAAATPVFLRCASRLGRADSAGSPLLGFRVIIVE